MPPTETTGRAVIQQYAIDASKEITLTDIDSRERNVREDVSAVSTMVGRETLMPRRSGDPVDPNQSRHLQTPVYNTFVLNKFTCNNHLCTAPNRLIFKNLLSLYQMHPKAITNAPSLFRCNSRGITTKTKAQTRYPTQPIVISPATKLAVSPPSSLAASP